MNEKKIWKLQYSGDFIPGILGDRVWLSMYRYKKEDLVCDTQNFFCV